MNIVTGCSGIDAIAYAALLLEIDVIGQIEIDDFCNKILELRFPGVKRLENVFDVRGDEFGTVDIFAFGDPCQPHSVAGKRQGTADERFIWPELLRIIQTMRPAWILNENVAGSVSNGVVRDKILQLESEGYRARAYTVPACAVGAPHRRERVFFVAHSRCPLRQGGIIKGTDANEDREGTANITERPNCPSKANVADTGCPKSQGWNKITERSKRQTCDESTPPDSAGETMGNAESIGRRPRWPESAGQRGESCTPGTGGETLGDTKREGWTRANNTKESAMSTESSQFMADTGGTGQQKQHATAISDKLGHRAGGSYAAGADRPTQSRLGRNVNGFSGRLHEPGGYENSGRIYEAFEAIFTATLEQIFWPAGYGAEQYDYEPPRVATGIKNRTNRLKALGNSIVWQQIFPFLLAIKLVEGQVRG